MNPEALEGTQGRARLLEAVIAKRRTLPDPKQADLIREEQDSTRWKYEMKSWGWLGGGKRSDGFEGLPDSMYPGKKLGAWVCSTCFRDCGFTTMDQMAMFDHLATDHLQHFSICAWCGVAASESRRYLRQHLIECLDRLVLEAPWEKLAASSR